MTHKHEPLPSAHYDMDKDVLTVRLAEHDDVDTVKTDDWLLERRVVETNELVYFQIKDFRRMIGLLKKLLPDALRMGPNEWDEYVKDVNF